MITVESPQRHIPESLKNHEHWVLWAVDGQGRKRPLAPWIRGDMYPVKWGSDAPKRPETDWDTAWAYYRSRGSFSAPDGINPNEALPAPLLLHDPLDPPLMQVDFDDVRDPESGEISDEVLGIIEQLDAFTEISQSGTGLHTFVRAELPGGLGKFIAELKDIGHIEMYDHGRCVGATWDWIPESPKTVQERQDVIDELVKSYEDEDQRRRRIQEPVTARDGQEDEQRRTTPTVNSSQSDGDTSPYFDIKTMDIADEGTPYRTKRTKAQSPGQDHRGPHPAHGNTSHKWTESSNFAVRDGTWYCFAHDCGGGAIQLAAIMADAVDCGAWGRKPNGTVTEDPDAMLKTALWLRDRAGAVSDDAKPPYTALVGAAQHADLSMADSEKGILGENTARLARTVFDNLDYSDL